MTNALFPAAGRSVSAIGFATADLMLVEQTVAASGGRYLAATGDVATQPLADILLIDATDPDGLAMTETSRHTTDMIVRASLQTVDAVTARWPDAEIVIGSDPIDLHLTLAGVLQRAAHAPRATFDVASDEGLRLQRLADEIARIARTLVELPEGLSAASLTGRNGFAARDLDVPAGEAPGMQTAVTAAEVRAIIRLRRLRDRYFPAELFADPAWDMLLDLAAARIERVRVAVSSLCIAAAVPPTTALRWIKAMTEKGLMRRVADPHDARRIFIQLSDDAAAAMDKYLRAARGGTGQPV